MNLFNTKLSYKDLQKQETQKEINNLLKSGAQKVSLQDYKEMLKAFNLTLDLDPNNYLHKYYNTANEQHYLEATTSPLDIKGISAFNIKGQWYKENVTPQTALKAEFQKFRNDYFVVLKSGHILSI